MVVIGFPTLGARDSMREEHKRAQLNLLAANKKSPRSEQSAAMKRPIPKRTQPIVERPAGEELGLESKLSRGIGVA